MRLIDADALMRELKRRSDEAAEARMTLIAEDFIELVRDAGVVEVPRWIPVTERMPEGYKVVLVRSSAGFTHTARYVAICDEWQSAWNHDRMESEITHWMPLPEPPEVE